MSANQFHNTAVFVVSVLKYVAYTGVLVCAAGLFLAAQKHYPLWFHSIKTEGTVSGYKTISWQSRRIFGGAVTSSTSTNLPVITFQDQKGEGVSFVDNFGHSRLLAIGEKVAVLYEADNPSNATVDKGFANWMAVYIWLFGLAANAFGALRFRTIDYRVREQ